MQIANYEPWLGLVKVQNLTRAIARARLAWNKLGSNKLESIRFFDSSNPQFYCITGVTMIDATYLNKFRPISSCTLVLAYYDLILRNVNYLSRTTIRRFTHRSYDWGSRLAHKGELNCKSVSFDIHIIAMLFAKQTNITNTIKSFQKKLIKKCKTSTKETHTLC